MLSIYKILDIMGINIGDAFKKLGNDIKNGVEKSNNTITKAVKSIPPPKPIPPIKIQPLPPLAKIKLPPPPPPLKPLPPPKIDMKALQDATKIITGIVALTPLGKGLLMASTTIADKATGGKATAYLGSQNSTLSMVPGGILAQQIASVATNGKSNDTISKLVPDPKKMAIQDVKKVGTTLVTNPKQTGNTIKSVAQSNVATLKQNPAVSTLAKPAQSIAPTPHMIPNNAKPSLHTALTPHAPTTIQSKASSFVANTKKPMSMAQPPAIHTLKITPPAHEDTPTISAPQVKPTLIQAAESVPSVDTPTPVVSTLSKNTALQAAVLPPAPTVTGSSSSMVLPLAGGLVALLFFIMRR